MTARVAIFAILCAGAVRAERFVELGPTRAQRDSSASSLDFPFTARADEELTGAAVRIAFAAPVESMEVLVNDERIALLTGQEPPRDIPVRRELLADRNTLSLRLRDRQGRCVARPQAFRALKSVGVVLTADPVPLPDELALLPLPFFDRGHDASATVPVVLAHDPSPGEVRLGALAASWLAVDAPIPIAFQARVGELPDARALVLLSGAADAEKLGLEAAARPVGADDRSPAPSRLQREAAGDRGAHRGGAAQRRGEPGGPGFPPGGSGGRARPVRTATCRRSLLGAALGAVGQAGAVLAVPGGRRPRPRGQHARLALASLPRRPRSPDLAGGVRGAGPRVLGAHPSRLRAAPPGRGDERIFPRHPAAGARRVGGARPPAHPPRAHARLQRAARARALRRPRSLRGRGRRGVRRRAAPRRDRRRLRLAPGEAQPLRQPARRLALRLRRFSLHPARPIWARPRWPCRPGPDPPELSTVFSVFGQLAQITGRVGPARPSWRRAPTRRPRRPGHRDCARQPADCALVACCRFASTAAPLASSAACRPSICSVVRSRSWKRGTRASCWPAAARWARLRRRSRRRRGAGRRW